MNMSFYGGETQTAVPIKITEEEMGIITIIALGYCLYLMQRQILKLMSYIVQKKEVAEVSQILFPASEHLISKLKLSPPKAKLISKTIKESKMIALLPLSTHHGFKDGKNMNKTGKLSDTNQMEHKFNPKHRASPHNPKLRSQL
jgi:hypothetical protein